MSENFFNKVVYGAVPMYIILYNFKRKIRITKNFRNNIFQLISSDIYHKKMLLQSLNIPLILSELWGKNVVCTFLYSIGQWLSNQSVDKK